MRPPSAIPQTDAAQLTAYFQMKLAAEMGPHNLRRLQEAGSDDIYIMDVRSPEGYREGRVPGAVNVQLDELPARLSALPTDKVIVCYCWDATCYLSTKAAYVLASKGFRVKEMVGGFEAWQASGFPVEK